MNRLPTFRVADRTIRRAVSDKHLGNRELAPACTASPFLREGRSEVRLGGLAGSVDKLHHFVGRKFIKWYGPVHD